MTKGEHQTAIRVLILMEPKWGHECGCPGINKPENCNCYLRRNAEARITELFNAGLLKTDTERIV